MAERITKINRLEKSKEQLKLESLNEVTDAIVENKDSTPNVRRPRLVI